MLSKRLRRLEARAAVALAEDEFGDIKASLNPLVVRWAVVLLVGEPLQHARLPLRESALAASKVELLLQLHLCGWRLVSGLLGTWSRGEEWLYS